MYDTPLHGEGDALLPFIYEIFVEPGDVNRSTEHYNRMSPLVTVTVLPLGHLLLGLHFILLFLHTGHSGGSNTDIYTRIGTRSLRRVSTVCLKSKARVYLYCTVWAVNRDTHTH